MSDSEKIDYLMREVADLKQQLSSIQCNQPIVFGPDQVTVSVANEGHVGPFEFAPIDPNQVVLLPHIYVENPSPLGTTFTFDLDNQPENCATFVGKVPK